MLGMKTPMTGNTPEGRNAPEQEKENELEEKWKLMRECKMFMEENSETWQRKTEEERVRIEREEKQTRLEMMEKKRKKYGKAGNRKLTDLEDDKIKMETKSKQ